MQRPCCCWIFRSRMRLQACKVATSYHFCWQFWWAWVSQRNMSVINLVDLSLWSVLGTHVIGRAKKKQINQIHAVILEGDKELSYFRSVRGDLGVSKNNGTPSPKSSILIGFSIINHPFWGIPIFWKHPYHWYHVSSSIVQPTQSVTWHCLLSVRVFVGTAHQIQEIPNIHMSYEIYPRLLEALNNQFLEDLPSLTVADQPNTRRSTHHSRVL